MARSQNQKLKLLYLMKIFCEQTDPDHPMSLSDIISQLEKYGITSERKSLYDDFECLRLFGADIEYEKNKGYYIAERAFELPELQLLVDAVQSSKFITYRKSVELIKKLENLAGSHDAKKLQRQVYVANRVKTMNESIYYSVDSINSAISENVRIKFKYFDWDENKKRKLRYNGKEYRVSPWALVWNDENYYMVAYDTEKGIIKHYRVDKMLNISLDKEKRDGEKMFENFDVALYSRTMFGMFGGEEETVSLRCRNTKANVIIDRFGKDVTFFKDDDEHFIVNVKVSVSPVFLTWIMNFGSDIKIVSPQSVIRDLKALAKDVLCQYE